MQEIILLGHLISNVGLKCFKNKTNYLINDMINEKAASFCEEKFEPEKEGNGVLWAAVMDGMGSGESGERASLLAARELQKSAAMVNADISEKETERLARQGFLNANRRIMEEKQKNSILGTAATLMCLCKNRIKLFHLGDGRAYLLREKRLYQLTKDQTLAALKIDAGIYEKEAPEARRDGNCLTEYIGADETMTSLRPLESNWITLKEVDKVLLCSGGLYRLCTDKEIKEVLVSASEPDRIANKLVRLALSKGGTDNITCLVLTAGRGRKQTGE